MEVFRSIDELPSQKPKSGYDIITLFHVLEHLPDPIQKLTELSSLLNDSGEIIVEIPNADDALLTLYENEAFSKFTYWSCHLFLFNTKTLKLLADKAALKVNYIKQVQRYGIANHLYWLSKGKPGGHDVWDFLDGTEINKVYAEKLDAIEKCDTIIVSLSK